MRLPLPALAALAALLATASGCTAPAYVGQTGRVTPKGSFRASFGSGYQVNTTAADLVRDGRDLARQLDSKRVACPDTTLAPECWNVADVRPVVNAAYRFATVAPLSSNTQFGVRYGLASGVDVGLRYGPGNKGADLGLQLFGPREASQAGWAGSLFAGYGKRDLGTLGDVIESVFQGEASLTDYQVAVVAGRQYGEAAHLYLGGRWLVTRWKVQVLPDIPIIFDGGEVQRELLGTDPSGTIHQLGAVLGGAVGYRHLWLGAELNLLQSFGHARILGEEQTLSGLGVMPAVYLYGQY